MKSKHLKSRIKTTKVKSESLKSKMKSVEATFEA